jgi:hypothetical protein
MQTLAARLSSDAIRVGGCLIAYEPSNRHARIDNQRHYSLPSSINF